MTERRRLSPAPVMRGVGGVCVALTLVLVSACSTVDFDAAKTASYVSLDTAETTLSKRVAPAIEARDGQSGFYPLSAGIDALSARLVLIERAEKTLDVQYYLWGADPIGDLFFERLFEAADRGVRVRLLIDDIGTRTIEDRLPALDAHPQIALRLFNPFPSRGFRLFDAWDGLRLNRRMHNKSLTADNAVTIMGGRNIAAEYYSANPKYNFGDIDVIGIGPVVDDTSAMFDRYWNDRHSVPYGQLNPDPPAAADSAQLRKRLRASYGSLAGSAYSDIVGARFAALEFVAVDSYYWAPYALVYDAPDKALADDTGSEDRMTTSLVKVVEAAERELLVMSPYFVPRRGGIDWLSGIAQKGVQVDVLTNGLAANDHLLVYGGYAPARKPLLRVGVRFFELRGDLVFDGTEASGTHDADSKLHGKSFLVDRRYAFIGSFNWDPRSANLNTEMGVVIDSPGLASAMAEGIYEAIPEMTYTVTLEDDGALRWTTQDNGERRVFGKEPESTWWKRFKANLTRILPVRGQL